MTNTIPIMANVFRLFIRPWLLEASTRVGENRAAPASVLRLPAAPADRAPRLGSGLPRRRNTTSSFAASSELSGRDQRPETHRRLFLPRPCAQTRDAAGER